MQINRLSPIEIKGNEFRRYGHQLIDKIADFIDDIYKKPVTLGETPKQIHSILKSHHLSDEEGSVSELISNTADLLFTHSLLNGHPKFFGYITSSAAPIGALADLLAATVNPNVGANILSPIATEIEKQTIQWLSEFIGLPPGYGGIMVSGGNMANFTAFLAGRTAKAPENIKQAGLAGISAPLIVYCSKATHTWIEKAVILFGHGLDAIHWISTDAHNKMDVKELNMIIKSDLDKGFNPFMVVGTAGDVSTGVVDNLKSIAKVCTTYNLWFHIDGAYGAPAAGLPELKWMFDGINEADSIALDPHKWLYSPLEAGCTLVKNPKHLSDTFSSHPDYYNFENSDDDPAHNFYEYGLQNSRGFRALKVWLALQQVGRTGYVKMISEDIELSRLLYKLAENHPNLQAISQNLSITTFRYIPSRLNDNIENMEAYLNELNEQLLNVLQAGGKLFLSNAVINEKYCLRACIVNFRTSKKDIEEVIEIIVDEGFKVNQKLQNGKNKS